MQNLTSRNFILSEKALKSWPSISPGTSYGLALWQGFDSEGMLAHVQASLRQEGNG